MVSLRLMPRDVKFFDLLQADGENLLAAARELRGLMDAYDDLDARIARIQKLEHAGDEIGDSIEERLEDAFITPIDRGDIHELTRRMDDVVDRVQEIAETMQIYDVKTPTKEAQRLTAILEEQAVEIEAALVKFESMTGLGDHLKKVHTLENEADHLSRAAIGQLFRESTDPLDVIKWRDIYTSLEEAIDAAEDVAEIMQRVIHKGS
jgi:predicted phosphate transport protein (TIGR00153 family)